MADINQTAADLVAVLESGLISEDLMKQIQNVDDQTLEFTNRIGSGSHGNPACSWVMDRYKVQNLANAVVDGADIDQVDNSEGQRVWNHSQTSVKEVKVSTRADSSDVVGRANTLAYQISKVATELRRDVEGIMLLNQGAVEDDGNTTAGLVGGLEAWIDGKVLVPTETGAAITTGVQTNALQQVNSGGTITGGGWDARTATTNLLPAWTYSTVTAGGITEAAVKAVVQALYENTGSRANRVLMTRPELHSTISDFYFSAGANVATLTAETNQRGPATAMTAVNTILTSYGLLDMIPNNLQPIGDAGSSSDTAFILDMSQIEQSFLTGYRSEPLAKTGLSRKMMIMVDYTLKVKNSEALGMIQGINPATAMA